MIHKYERPHVFRSRRPKWEDRPWQDRLWLMRTNNSWRFLGQTKRWVSGVERTTDRADQIVIWAVLVLFGVCIAWGLL